MSATKKFFFALVISVSFFVGYTTVADAFVIKGREDHHGYFTNRYDSQGDKVFAEGIPTSVNTASEFISYIEARLYSGTGRQRVGAAFIIQTMIGSAKNNPPTAAQVDEWEGRVRYADSKKRIQWNRVYSYRLNSYWQGNGAGSDPNDDAFYSESSTHSASAIVFYNPNGTEYGLKHACANPIGDMGELPANESWDMIGYATASVSGGGTTGRAYPGTIPTPVNVKVGQTVTFQYYLQNQGTNASKQIWWQSRKATISSFGDYETGTASAGTFAGGQQRNIGSKAITITSADSVGSTICRLIVYQPSDSEGGGTVQSGRACVKVVSTPTPPASSLCDSASPTYPERGVSMTVYQHVNHNFINIVRDANGGIVDSTPYYVMRVKITAPSGAVVFNGTADSSNTTSTVAQAYKSLTPTESGEYMSEWEYSGPHAQYIDYYTYPIGIIGYTRSVVLVKGKPVVVATPIYGPIKTPHFASPPAIISPAKITCRFRVYTKPYFQVKNGDIQAGAGFSIGSSSNCSSSAGAGIIRAFNNGGSGSYSGSSSDVAAIARSSIDGFVSAAGAGGRGQPTGLSFTNSSGTYGGDSGMGLCIPDYGALVPPSAPSSYVVPSMTIGSGTKRDILVNGDVFISGDVRFNNTTWGSADTIPSFRIIAKGGNIYISDAVTTLDGIYVATPNGNSSKGNIYTCANGFGAPADSFIVSQCDNNRLTVNGAFIANSVRLLRTNSTVRDAATGGGVPAEIFNFTPETWMAIPETINRAAKIDYDAITGLPPVL